MMLTFESALWRRYQEFLSRLSGSDMAEDASALFSRRFPIRFVTHSLSDNALRNGETPQRHRVGL